MTEQFEMLHNIRRLITLSTRWFLRSKHIKGDLEPLIKHYSERVAKIEKLIPELMGGVTRDYLASITEKFSTLGLPPDTGRKIATSRAIYTALNIIEVATEHHFDLIKTAKVYFAGGEQINLLWFRDQLANDGREGHWNTLARLTLRDELDTAQRALTVAIMHHDKASLSATQLINQWMRNNQRALQRWERLLTMLHSGNQTEYSMFFITIRELLDLILASQT